MLKNLAVPKNLRTFATEKRNYMEATVLNTAQQNILRMLSFVKDEKTVSDVENVLKEYFAKQLDASMDVLVENGSITLDTIESWGKEHMRTSYK